MNRKIQDASPNKEDVTTLFIRILDEIKTKIQMKEYHDEMNLRLAGYFLREVLKLLDKK